MKKILIILMTTFSLINASGQEKKQKIIIDITSTDNKVYQSVMLTLNIMTESHPNTKFEVIAYGEAVPMFVKNKTIIANDIAKFNDNNNIKFIACEVSMTLLKIKKEDLLDGIVSVENAIIDIVEKQSLGWGYIKSGN